MSDQKPNLLDATAPAPGQRVGKITFSPNVPKLIMRRVTETFGPCEQCGGSGEIVVELAAREGGPTIPWSQRCKHCQGSGRVLTQRTTET